MMTYRASVFSRPGRRRAGPRHQLRRTLILWLLVICMAFLSASLLWRDNTRKALVDEQSALIKTQHDLIVLQEDLLGEIFAVGFFDAQAMRDEQVTVSAYSSTRAQTDSTPWTTADMSGVRPGIVAVSRDLMSELGLQFGQRIYLSGFGIFEVRDVMHRRWSRRVDIWCPDKTAAEMIGVQPAIMTWLDMNG